jgi:lipopolysaccharide transport system ATP-binding protein
MHPAICVDNLAKSYRLGLTHSGSIRELVNRAAAGMLRRARPAANAPVADATSRDGGNRLFWALRDVSFDVQPGEVVGIIGKNGAGKSTLLKILSRITPPTRGRVETRGRVASLLEVGTGFHPELTGRENVFLNGAILGMTRREVAGKLAAIVAFAEVEQFLDTPVKRYSSGMYVRLAFAVAAHLDPEILIVDEVLAVGDAGFQKKCLGKMSEVSFAGRTVLFVSHNMVAVKSLCEHALWLAQGKVTAYGPTRQVVSDYLSGNAQSTHARRWDRIEDAPGDSTVRLRSVVLRAHHAAPDDLITTTTPVDVECEVLCDQIGLELNVAINVFDQQGTCAFASDSPTTITTGCRIRSICRIPENLLNDGVYRIDVMLVRDASKQIAGVEQALQFEVVDVQRNGNWFGKWPGVVRPRLDWRLFDECGNPLELHRHVG